MKSFHGFWYVRGMLLAFTIVSSFAGVFSLNMMEGVRFFHAIIVGWNLIASQIGSLVGAVLFLPSIPAVGINYLIFVSSFSVAVIIGVRKKSDRTITRFRNELGDLSNMTNSQKVILLNKFEILASSLIEDKRAVFSFRWLGALLGAIPGFLIGLPYAFIASLENNNLVYLIPIVGIWFYLLYTALDFLRICNKPAFNGTIHVFIGLLTVEVAHQMDLPAIGTRISSFSIDILGPLAK